VLDLGLQFDVLKTAINKCSMEGSEPASQQPITTSVTSIMNTDLIISLDLRLVKIIFYSQCEILFVTNPSSEH
jgi:hypothetical protein